jgi:hypothetical protein
MRQAMGLEGYRHLLAITSLDGLVEASRWGPWLAAGLPLAVHACSPDGSLLLMSCSCSLSGIL